MGLQLEFAFRIDVTLAPEAHIGRGPAERLTFTPITGGSVEGPLLRGEVVPGGGDWGVERSGISQLEARYLLRADDGAIIDILNRGYYRASPDVEERFAAGEDVDPREYYFRCAPVFQTDAPAHRWLAEHQFVGSARVIGTDISIDVYVVK